jgi:hypothetical protein
MSESNALALTSNRELTPAIWNMIRDMAPMMHQSRLFGVSSTEQAAAIMLKGFELGLSITASFELVQVVQGKPALSPRGAMALLHNSPLIKEIKITRLANGGTFEGYECFMSRSNGFAYTGKWTMAQAIKAGLVKPDSGWANYPENMCMWRAIGFTADVVAPDITAGLTGLMKMPEKYGVALTAEGDVIPGSFVSAPAETAPVESPKAPTQAAITLDDLCNMFGGEAILKANEGKIPSTDEEVQALASKMMGGQ